MRTLEFELPARLEAGEPPEARGLARDEVRLLVSSLAAGTISHGHFRDLAGWLDAGDVLVVNTSGTINAALSARRRPGRAPGCAAPRRPHRAAPGPGRTRAA
jgi:S-adenosylmethionine:tRNA ribosyltransferase-isomerase